MHKIAYTFKKESVTVVYNNQAICYHSYSMNERSGFSRFRNTLLLHPPEDIAEVMTLAVRNKVNSQVGHIPPPTEVVENKPLVQTVIF